VPIGNSNYVIDAHASASASSFPWMVHVHTETIGNPPPGDYAWSATAQATASGDFYTVGPSRTGFIQFDIEFSEQFDDYGFGALISDATNTYAFYPVNAGPVAPICNAGNCEFRGTLPLLLGTADTFHVALTGIALANHACRASTCPGGDASLSFSVLEADGITPVVFSAVPEPKSYLLLCLGLTGGVAGAWRSSRVL
jgi:hypothetical protein